MTASGPQRRLVAVLVCHNRRALTLSCLEALSANAAALRRAGVGAPEAILVDDGGGDGTAQAVAAHFAAVRVLHGDGTLWWAGGMELGLRAVDGNPDFQLWLNDDVGLDDDGLARMVEAHDRWRERTGRSAIVVGATRDPAHPPSATVASYGGARRSGFHPFRLRRLSLADHPQPCDTMNGNAVLVPGAAARSLGGIDPVFIGVQGMADTDYGLRARALGQPIIVAPGSVGTCAPNGAPPPWRDSALGWRQRIAALWGPKGYPWPAWSRFVRRHGGPLWPLWLAMPYARGALDALRPVNAPRRVALLEGIVPAYRVPLLRRLSESADPLFMVHHGDGLSGLTARASAAPLPIAAVRCRNFFWPRMFGRGRIAWTAGAATVLCGRFDAAVAGFHVHDLGIWTLWLSRRLLGRPRLILNGHFRLDEAGAGLRLRLRRWLRRRLVRGADAVLPYTETGAEACRRAGVPEERIFVVHNSVDVAAARSALAALPPGAAETVRRRHGLPDGDLFLFLGRLYPNKRVDLAIAAVRRLRRDGVACCLLVVGDGIDTPRLHDLAGEDPGIRFAPAEYDDSALAALFAAATAVVVPDSVGLIAAHAAAHGVPVVACRDGRTHGPEYGYLADGRNALLVPTSQPDDLAAALECLCADRPLLSALRRGAWDTGDRLGVDAAAIAYVTAARCVLEDRRHG